MALKYKRKYALIGSAIVMVSLVMNVYVATSSFAMIMMPGNQTKGKLTNMTAGSNMTGALMKSNAAKSMANSSK